MFAKKALDFRVSTRAPTVPGCGSSDPRFRGLVVKSEFSVGGRRWKPAETGSFATSTAPRDVGPTPAVEEYIPHGGQRAPLSKAQRSRTSSG